MYLQSEFFCFQFNTNEVKIKNKKKFINIPVPLTVLVDLFLLEGNLAYCYLQLRLLEEDHTGKLAKKKADFDCNKTKNNNH